MVLVTAVVMAVLATPGLDYLPPNTLRTPASRVRAEEQMGPVGMHAGWAVAVFNRRCRLPLVKVLEPLQKPFRIAQSWNLYRDGPRRMRELEIQVDGKPVYRMGSSNLNWLAGPLSNRKIRPVVESTARSPESRNWRGLARFVVERARLDYPEATFVALVFEVADFPGEEFEASHRIVAESPEWKARLP